MKYLIAGLVLPLALFVVAISGSDSSNAAQSGTTSGHFVQCLNIQGALIEGGVDCAVEVPIESPNSLATLFNDGSRLTLNVIDRHLEANNAYSLWWVIFNDPSGCIDGCGGPDVFDELGPTNGIIMNATGGVSSHLGNLVVSAWIETGGVSSGSGEVLAGDPATLNIATAEVHIVVRSHGPASGDAAILDKQINSVSGGCVGLDPDGDELFPCWDPHAIVFAP